MTLNYRVGKTSGAAHVAREFGYDPAQYGNLTPELVHDAGAKHDSHLVNLQQKLQNELNLVKVQGASTQTLQNMDFRQRLLLIKANHTAKGQIQTNGFQQSLKAIQASPQQAIAMQAKRSAFNAYINAKDFDPIPTTADGSGGGNSLSANTGKGFLGGLFDFFTGKN